MPYWRTCTFKDIGTKKQDYLDLLAKEMTKKDFQQVEKNKLSTRTMAPFLEENSLVFGTPDGKFNIAIQAVPSNGNLKVGFIVVAKIKQSVVNFVYFVLGSLASFILLYLIKCAFPSFDRLTLVMLFFIIWFSIGFGLPLFLLSRKTWNQQLMRILVKTADSMGSKQISPFKRTWITKM